MSGIAGLALHPDTPASPATLQGMVERLAHRGGKESAIRFSENMGLATTDNASATLDHPHYGRVFAADCTLINARPLRQMLEAEGISLASDEPEAVILPLYQKFGPDFVTHLQGSFAIAILDEERKELILARDAVGAKPLYYARLDNGIAFASEPRALAALENYTPRLHSDALASLLNRRYTQGTQTLFADIRRVGAGEVLVLRDGDIFTSSFFPLNLLPKSFIQEEDALASFDELLGEKVQDYIEGIGKCALLLSGGIDSSVIASRLRDVTANLVTFTIGFDNCSRADEMHLATELAQELRAEHHTITFTEDDFWHYLPVYAATLDDLVTEPNHMLLLKLSELAAPHASTLLLGAGGDEILAGFTRLRPQSRWHKLLRRPERGYGDAYDYSEIFRDPAPMRRFYRQEHITQPLNQALAGYSSLQQLQSFELLQWVPYGLNTSIDRLLGHKGVEPRLPLLDKEMVTFCFALPDRFKQRRHHGKWLMKQWLNERHPALNPWQPRRGFTLPVPEWLEKKRSRIHAYLSGHEGLAPLIHMQKLAQWLSGPVNKDSAKLLFSLLCFALWYDHHLNHGKSCFAEKILP